RSGVGGGAGEDPCPGEELAADRAGETAVEDQLEAVETDGGVGRIAGLVEQVRPGWGNRTDGADHAGGRAQRGERRLVAGEERGAGRGGRMACERFASEQAGKA